MIITGLKSSKEHDLYVAEALAIVYRLAEVEPESRDNFLAMLNCVDWDYVRHNKDAISELVKEEKQHEHN